MASLLVAIVASRLGVPSLVAFLALGMLLGSDGLGGIEFDDAELARRVGIVGLAAILFEGGLSTSWRRLRRVVAPAALLSTVGVAVTAVLTGISAYYLFDLTWLDSILLGAVVSSTDAAAVFATLRFTNVSRRLARTLEAETGGNDPMAIALTVGLIAWIQDPGYGFPDLRARSSARSGSACSSGSCSGSRRRGPLPGCRMRSARSRRWRRSRPPRSRSAPPT